MFLVILFASVAYVCNCEYWLHRVFMHRPVWKFDYPFQAHAVTHHGTLKADKTYHAQSEADKKKIPMAWWNGPALILIFVSPVVLVSWLLGMWSIAITVAIVLACYFAAYEYLHWCMHLPLPRRRIVERSWFFYRLNGHHLLHHRYMGKNFNVVLPLCDLCFGTLVLRSKIKFPQARGPSVPDVQPR